MDPAKANELPMSRKLIFVIMPFTKSPLRNAQELEEFFEQELKKSIETDTSFSHSYEVRRSGTDFDINGTIIRDLFRADIVICDLSGDNSNPNVMFELGIRLTCSNKPTILIREASDTNQKIFDLQSFHAYPYNPKAYAGLRRHIGDKIRQFESGKEKFRSPILAVLGDETKIHRIDRMRATNLLAMLKVGLVSHLRTLTIILNEHLRPISEFQFDPNMYMLARQIDNNYTFLQDIDWSEIRLAMAPHPAISYYLSTRYLDGVIEESIERDFSTLILTFYETHFGNLMNLIGFNLSRVRNFADAATFLSVACEYMTEILRSEDGTPENVNSVIKLRELLNPQDASQSRSSEANPA